MASIILLFSELVRNHEWDAEALMAAYPLSSNSSFPSSCAAAVRKTLKDEGVMQKKQITEESLLENPLESRVCLDSVVWP
ncbi:hypothetical protein RJT34_21657 [Clitoria ternatea]|uniref:Uncharacterized protein n=1 Tax=Clitoria ternatea TaxID=43366 RepID=A0AAN9IUY2_CLITE